MDAAFDPTQPLTTPPDPWRSLDQPSIRPGPPYHMTEMIAAEPHLARRLLGRLRVADSPAAALAERVVTVARAGDPILVTGCGTSEHAAIGVAEILAEALREVRLATRACSVAPIQAFEYALDPMPAGLVIGVSHEGGTAATNAALAAARGAGADVAAITATEGSPAGQLAGIVVETGEMDGSWCHTVGYVSPLLAATAVAGHLRGNTVGAGGAVDAEGVARLMAQGAGDTATAELIAERLAGRRHLVVIASGADRAAGRELVLKIEEAAWIPSAYRDLETFLHGHLPATAEETGLVLILTDRAGRSERVARAAGALAAARTVGVETAAIVAADAAASLAGDLVSAGRLTVPEAPAFPSAVAALLGSATPLQLLTERLARARGTNPDAIRRDDPRYRSASDAAEAVGAEDAGPG